MLKFDVYFQNIEVIKYFKLEKSLEIALLVMVSYVILFLRVVFIFFSSQ